MDVSSKSRGALEESYVHDSSNLFVDKNGELSIREKDGILAKTARVTGTVASESGVMHRLVEDWNRSKTFKKAFALAYGNLEQTSKNWQVGEYLKDRKMLDKIKKDKGNDYIPEYNDLVEILGSKTEGQLKTWMENKAGRMAYNGMMDLHFEYAKWNKASAIRADNDAHWSEKALKTGIGQFAHYRFNMVNLMFKWMKDAGISYRAGDFTSEEAIKPLRMAMLQATMFTATIAAKTNFMKLFDNDVLSTGQAMYAWLSGKREEWVEGKMSPETTKLVEAKTHGQGGWYFLGPNTSAAVSLFEVASHVQTQFKHTDPSIGNVFDIALKKAIEGDATQELYNKLYPFNAQAARFFGYTVPVGTRSGVVDALQLELGTFLSKEQREFRKMIDRKLGLNKGKRKTKAKPLTAPNSLNSKAALKSLELFGQ